MSDSAYVAEKVAVLTDWKEGHTKQHDTMWQKFKENDVQHTEFMKSIERLETKMAIYVGVAVFLGSILGSVAGALALKLFSMFLHRGP